MSSAPRGESPATPKRGRKALRPDPEDGPAAVFACALLALKERAGDPSYEQMCREFGAAASKSALSSAARGRDLPTWETSWEYVRSLAVTILGEDIEQVRKEWSERWEDARLEIERQNLAQLQSEEDEARVAAAAPGPVVTSPSAEPREGQAHGDAQAGSSPQMTPSETAQSAPARPVPRVSWPRVLRRRAAVFGAVVVGSLAALVGVAALLIPGHESEPKRPIPGDASLFMGDLTIPDGTPIKAGELFAKEWRIRNTGVVPWHDRYLQRVGGIEGTAACSAPTQIPIPHTEPGADVTARVIVSAGKKPGGCKMYWKMVDQDGVQYLPDTKPIYFDVVIVE